MDDIIKDGKVVAFMNMKGGVAKTTLCLSLGEYLAKFEKSKVLFIDLDPQFNLTQTLLHDYKKEDEYLASAEKGKDDPKKIKTVYELYESYGKVSLDSIPERIKPEELIQKLKKKNGQEIHVVYGSLELIILANSEQYKFAIEKFINENSLKEKYDFIFLDCPPTISLYTSSAMHSSDYYIVPNRLDRYSILGIQSLEKSIRIEGQISYRPIKMKPLGILYTIMESDNSQRGNDIQSEFERNDVVKKMGIFTANSRKNVNLIKGKNRNITSRYSASKEDIENISKEFLLRIERI